MAQQKVQLRKIRDFGDNFSDTFQFIRQEFKPLATSFLLISGIFILAYAVVAAMFQQAAFTGLINLITKGVYTNTEVSTILTPTYFLMIGLNILSLTAMRTVVAAYMHHYDTYNASPTVQQVWQIFIRHLLIVFIFSIIRFVLVIAGCFLCFAPGIYLFTVLMPFSNAIVSEDLSIGDAFSRCFDLIKENFWISLAVYIVGFVIFWVCSASVSFSVGLIVGLISYFSTKEVNTTVPIVTGVLSFIQYLFYLIFFISASIHYYNLVEIKDGTGLARRLENLGSNINPNTEIEEQY